MVRLIQLLVEMRQCYCMVSDCIHHDQLEQNSAMLQWDVYKTRKIIMLHVIV